MRTVRFKLDPGTNKVTAEEFVRAMRSLLGSVGDLGDWTIRHMSFASPLLLEAQCNNELHKPYATFARNVAAIESGKLPRGGWLGQQAKLLDSMDLITGTTFGTVQIAPSGVKPVTVSRGVVDQVRRLTGQSSPSLMIHARQQPGQLRGFLEQITVRQGQHPRFAIRDRVSGDRVDCRIPGDSPQLVGIAARLIGKRVTIEGMMTFGEQSRPTSIIANSIQPIDEFVIPFDQLPRLRLTEDGNAVAQVRRLRDA